MNSKDGVPRKAILVMTAILVSVILGAQASTRVTHPVLGPSTPLAPLSTTLPKNTAIAQVGSKPGKSQGSSLVKNNSPNVVKEAVKNGQLYAVSNNRVVHAGGELPQSATWTNDKIYYVNNLSIPSGVTLTIEEGTTIRVEGSNGFKVDGGSIVTRGTSSNPVIITSSNDPIGAPGDYGKAVDVRSGSAFLHGVAISNATVGVAVDGGAAIIQGSIKDVISYGVTACDWADIQCAVDASQVDITSLASKACGKALLADDTLFTPNCDGTVDPGQNLDAGIAAYMQSVASRNDACAAGDTVACDSAAGAVACVSNNLHTLSGGLAFVVPEVATQEDILLFSSRARVSAASYAIGQVVDGSTTPVISSLLTNMVDAFGQLKTAYDSCS